MKTLRTLLVELASDERRIGLLDRRQRGPSAALYDASSRFSLARWASTTLRPCFLPSRNWRTDRAELTAERVQSVAAVR